MARLLRHLLLVAALLLSLAGHGTAMASGLDGSPVAARPHAHALHHDGGIPCAGGQHCPASGKADGCCMVGHCLFAVVAGGAVALPAFRPALPVPANAAAPLAEPQAAPERPPRLA